MEDATPVSGFPTYDCTVGRHERCQGWTAGVYVTKLCGCQADGCTCRGRATEENRPQLRESFRYIDPHRSTW